jgi:hypothetical protein
LVTSSAPDLLAGAATFAFFGLTARAAIDCPLLRGAARQFEPAGKYLRFSRLWS